MPAISMFRWIKANQYNGKVYSRGNRWHYGDVSTEESTPLTSIEKSGENWPGAREYVEVDDCIITQDKSMWAAPARCAVQSCLLSAGAQREKGGAVGI